MVLAILATSFTAQLGAQGQPAPGQQGPPQGPQQGPPQDLFGRALFPPEMVMQHQGEINLQDAQRATLQSAIQQAQSKFVEVQWKLSAEGEKLARLLQGATVDESQVLEQVDRVLALEREIKRAQMGLMVRIKNTLTPAQQAKLRELREGRD
jgi:Spy/CpxP family protein refolding chaperone